MLKALLNNKTVAFTLLLSGVLFFTQCAKMGSPAGGPKDEDPPVVIKAEPPDSSINFSPRKNITLSFDEFIVLKDIFQELILSPPVEGDMLAVVKGKKVVVNFPKEAEFDSTTYTLSFGNAIVDNNEANILENFEYIFSLKDYIDTLSVEGRVINSFDFVENEERMYVMLYDNLSDSAPLLEKPKYISRTNKLGNYYLHNLEAGTYRLFALQDQNNNMLYDLPDEAIAFSDSLIELHPDVFKDDLVIEDSVLYNQLALSDSLGSDSLLIDSLKAEIKYYTLFSELLYFKRKAKNQYLVDYTRDRPEKLFFTFNEPLAEALIIEPLNYSLPDSLWFVPDISKKNDTVIYWLTDTTMIADDSLLLVLNYHVYDSLFNLELRADTMALRIQVEKEKKKGARSRRTITEKEETETEEKVPGLKLGNNIKKPGSFDLNQHIRISSSSPIGNINTDRIEFIQMVDTIPVPMDFQTSRDTNSLYSFSIRYAPEELSNYRLLIPDSVVTDIYGVANDTLAVAFRTQSEDFYGSLTVSISNVTQNTIIQLLDKKEDVLRRHFIDSDTIVKFEYLSTKEYNLKAIHDENNNGEWDTGNYLLQKQPEKVEYYFQEQNVRANWEIDFSWQLIDYSK